MQQLGWGLTLQEGKLRERLRVDGAPRDVFVRAQTKASCQMIFKNFLKRNADQIRDLYYCTFA